MTYRAAVASVHHQRIGSQLSGGGIVERVGDIEIKVVFKRCRLTDGVAVTGRKSLPTV